MKVTHMLAPFSLAHAIHHRRPCGHADKRTIANRGMTNAAEEAISEARAMSQIHLGGAVLVPEEMVQCLFRKIASIFREKKRFIQRPCGSLSGLAAPQYLNRHSFPSYCFGVFDVLDPLSESAPIGRGCHKSIMH